MIPTAEHGAKFVFFKVFHLSVRRWYGCLSAVSLSPPCCQSNEAQQPQRIWCQLLRMNVAKQLCSRHEINLCQDLFCWCFKWSFSLLIVGRVMMFSPSVTKNVVCCEIWRQTATLNLSALFSVFSGNKGIDPIKTLTMKAAVLRFPHATPQNSTCSKLSDTCQVHEAS